MNEHSIPSTLPYFPDHKSTNPNAPPSGYVQGKYIIIIMHVHVTKVLS